jgi:hypothetical protein
MEMANSRVEIFSKQGTSLKNSTAGSFFNVPLTSVGDPRVIYDASSKHWFATIAFGTLAVSNSSDPTGNWKIYKFNQCSGDYLTLGVSDDKIVISSNKAGNGGGSYTCIVNKSELIAGSSNIDFKSINFTYPFLRPVQSLSPTTTEYMVSTGWNQPTNVTQLLAISGTPPGNLTIQSTNLTIRAVTNPALDPFGGNNGAYDFRVQDAAWFKGKLWYTLNNGCTPTNATQSVGCIRLVEINTNTTQPVQDFDFGVAGQQFFFPALRIDQNGSLDVVYGFSSPGVGVAVTGQTVSDPVGSLRQPATLKIGNSLLDNWGDYFGAGVDPSVPGVVWVAGEYLPSNSGNCRNSEPMPKTVTCWGTSIGSMSIPSFSMSINPAILQMSAPSPGGFATGHASLTITNFGLSGQITLSNSPNYSTALAGPILGYSQTIFNMTQGQTNTITVSASICSSTPSRTFTITGTSTVFTNSITFTVNITGQRSGACPE